MSQKGSQINEDTFTTWNGYTVTKCWMTTSNKDYVDKS